MKKKFLLFALLILAGAYFTACSSSKEEMSASQNYHNTDKPTFIFNNDENGITKNYKVEFADDSIYSLTIDGDKVEQNKISGFRRLVYEKLDGINKKNRFSFHFDDSTFNTKSFKENMKKIDDQIKNHKIKISGKILNKELMQKNLAEALEKLEKAKIKNFHFDFDSGKLDKELEKLNDELENLDLNFDINIDMKVDMEKAKEELNEAMKNLNNVHISIDILDSDLKETRFIY